MSRVRFAVHDSTHHLPPNHDDDDDYETGMIVEEEYTADDNVETSHAHDNNNNNNDEEEIIVGEQDETNHTSQQQQQHRAPRSNLHASSAAAGGCPNCGGRNIEHHEASGASVCTDCGVVVEENAIVSSVEFVEGAGGSSSMVGQFVSATSSKAYTGGGAGSGGKGGGGRYGYSRDSRETTLANGRRRIQDLASRLRLGTHYVDAAHRLFGIAVEKNFVQGRRTAHVVAACLYMACRQEKSQHMLIDFSDALQVNVFTLGACFLKFRRLLGLKLELIDPALYIYRFAAHLDLESSTTAITENHENPDDNDTYHHHHLGSANRPKTTTTTDPSQAVALTALRLVARMKRDWIVAGRRPAGICAAALLIAARAHGCGGVTRDDVTRVLRVCGMTVHRRVQEFECTPSSQLALEQFHTLEFFDHEADPPVYTRNKLWEARVQAIRENNVPLLTSGALDAFGKRGDQWRKKNQNPTEKKRKLKQLYNEIEQNLSTSQMSDENESAAAGDPENSIDDAPDPNAEQQREEEEKDSENTSTSKQPANDSLVVVHKGTDLVPNNLEEWLPTAASGKVILLPDQVTAEERQPSAAPTEAKLSLAEWKQEMPESIYQELDDMFRTDEEVVQKEAIFNKINKDYISHQERKENERQSLKAAAKHQEEDDMAQAAGQARYKESRYKYNKRRCDDGSTTTEEQLRAAVSSRKVSRKINYDALSSIFGEDGSFAAATDNGSEEDGQGEEDDDAMLFEGM
jgi:transcription factor IIIB subunit 2